MMAPGILTLRKYQEDAILAAITSWNRIRRPAVVLPTGAGKTVVFANLAKRWVETPGRTQRTKCVILVHREELVTQTLNKLKRVAPALTVGVVKGPLNEIDRDVIVASVATLSKPARLFPLLGKVGLVIVDECHHAAAASYMTVLRELDCFALQNDPGAVAVGFTATMSRSDSKSLGDVWQEIVFKRDILDMIAMGYLVPPRGLMVTVDGMSLEEVKRSRGDYQASSLSDMLITSGAITAVADAYLEHAKGLPGLLFAPTVESSFLFSEALKERGVRAAPVWGAMDERARRRTLRQFEEGELDVLANCMVLTEGFDSPRAQAMIGCRPTTSPVLYTQMVGRVLRTYPGKEFALVLDVTGASRMHGLATLTDLSEKDIPELLDGESLLEAMERGEREGALDLSGDIAIQEVDLFHRSGAVWLQTYEGVWFIACKNYVVFIYPELSGDTFSVGVRPMHNEGGSYVKRDVDMTTAMSWAEQEAAERDAGQTRLTSRSASWRKKKKSLPTEYQVDMAKAQGIEITGKNRAEVSDIMSIHFVSAMLDRAYLIRKAKIAEQDKVAA